MIYAGVAQLVGHQPSKLRVAGSSLVARSYFDFCFRKEIQPWAKVTVKAISQANVAQG